jgi:hypothetical protein
LTTKIEMNGSEYTVSHMNEFIYRGTYGRIYANYSIIYMKGQNSDSWFSKLDEISEKYSLNSPHDLIVNPSTKHFVSSF